MRARLTPEVRTRIATRVGVPADDLIELGGFESFVFETGLRGDRVIVKATWSGRRTIEELGAEQHFVRFLADRGAPVCRAVPLGDGEWIGSVPVEGGAFLVYAFEKAPGARLAPGDWNDAVVERWGELVGCLHRLASGYPGPPAPLRRPTWKAEYAEFDRMLAGEPEVQGRFRGILRSIDELPREPDAFGPMHTDLHAGNLFWHDGRPYAFDFDDLLDFWFVSDLAIVLYYGLRNPPWTPGDRQADFERMRTALLRGYAREHELPAWCHDALPLFLDLREHTLWTVLHGTVPEADRWEGMDAYLADAGERLRAGRPALDLRP